MKLKKPAETTRYDRISTRTSLKRRHISKKRIAIDGSKFRAQNSTKNNYNTKKIDQHLENIEKQTKDYIEELGFNDAKEIKTLSKKRTGSQLRS